MQQIDNQFFNRRAGTAILVGVLCLGLMVGLVIFFSKIYPIGFSCAAAESWVGPAEGTWETAENWSCGRVPTAADDVVLSTSTGYIIVTLSSGQTANFRSLTVGGNTGFATFNLAGNVGTGGDVTIDSLAYLVQQNAATQTIGGTLTVKNGGLITHSQNTTEHLYSVDFSAYAIDIQSMSFIEVSNKGYAGDGVGPGAGASSTIDGVTVSSGGAHGGNGGGRDSTVGGLAYCDQTNVTTMGSAGGLSDGFYGTGGGYISLRSRATTTIAGAILASGQGGGYVDGGVWASGGGGGGIRIISGSAIVGAEGLNLFANGGGGGGESAAGGGGGCIELLYHTTSTILGVGPLIGVNAGNHASRELMPQDGMFYVAQTNSVPSATFLSAIQTSRSAVTFSVNVTDTDYDPVTLVVEHSFDGVVWASSTLKEITTSQGSVTTSTGQISNIGGSTPTTTLAGVWDISEDAPLANVSQAYLRVVGSDAFAVGAVATSDSFPVVINPPSGLTLQNITADTATLSWTGDAVFSVYELDEETDTNSSGWVSGTEYALTSLTCGTRYVFYVRGRSSGGFQSGYSDSVTATTLPCPAAGSGGQTFSGGSGTGGGTAAPAPSAAAPTGGADGAAPLGGAQQTPSPVGVLSPSFLETAPVQQSVLKTQLGTLGDVSPTALPEIRQEVQRILEQEKQINQTVANSSEVITPTVGSEMPITVGGENHSVDVSEATENYITFKLHSHTLVLTLKKGEVREVDADDDGVNDMQLTYQGLVGGKPSLVLAPLIDRSEAHLPFVINNGALKTSSLDVLLKCNIVKVHSMEIATNPEFTSSTFVKMASSTRWHLPAVPGPSWLYVRFHMLNGVVFTANESIFVLPAAVPGWAALTAKLESPSWITFTRHLTFGSSGQEVRLLQSLLKAQGVYPVSQAITGYFGSVTRQAVILLQRKFKLPTIGEVGPATRVLLNTLGVQKQ